jgi:hypothetical protein
VNEDGLDSPLREPVNLKSHRARWVLSIVSVNIGLLYTIAAVSQPILRWSETQRPDKADIIAALRADQIEAYPAVHAASFLDRDAVDPRIARERLERPVLDGVAYQPLAGIPGVRTVFCNEADGWLVYDSDAWGFNNVGRTPGGSDLLIVGDSYVQGACVPVGTSFVDLLDKPGHSVYSLGLASAGPLTTLAQLKEYAHRIDATSVLWVFTAANDVMRNKPRASDLDVELGSALLVQYLDAPGPVQGLVERHAALAKQIRAQIDQRLRDGRAGRVPVSDDLRLVELRARLRRLWISLQQQNEAARQERLAWYRAHRIPVLRSVADEAKRFLAELDKQLFVVYLPTRRPHVLKEDFLAVFRSAGLPTLDLERVLETTEGLFAGAGAFHFSIDGNRRVAEAIDGALAEWKRAD